ncbi:HPr kinase/phosphorylase [Pseudorhodoplanes sp.]|uniref:HPr kinase/phosphorylase n=1 Tax=Pseudorhodoplanes sp. TaxID=1934341 RepID=UPI00391DC8EE
MMSTIHATGLLFGRRGVLIRGPSGSGKSRLALALLQSGRARFVRLVGDDRLHLTAAHGRLLMQPAAALQGLIEVRGLGIVRMPYEPLALSHIVVDLAAADGLRLPEPEATVTEILGARLARLPVAPGNDPFPLILAYLTESAAGAASL